MTSLYLISFFAAFAMAILLTPFVKRFALWVGAVDRPNHRKVHTVVMPRLGGLGIFFSFLCAFVVISPALPEVDANVIWGLLLGGSVIVLIGALDDKFDLSPKVKLAGQLAAAGIVVAFGLKINVGLIDFPFEAAWLANIGWISIPLTIVWIVGVTNAINLIDGLDGLAGGVSAIATATMLVLALMMGNITVVLLCAILLGSVLGFLVFNFHPAKIFMGDSGALFLGFSLATLSVLGFKQATMISFVVPLLVLGVPLSDTLFAIIRRLASGKPISVADKSHLHHGLLRMGLSHRNTVLVIYGISIVFGVCAIILYQTTYIWTALAIIFVVLFLLEIAAEAIGMFSKNRRPVLKFLRKVSIKTARLIGARSVK
jgi:UDP-GlcNAc:undecaprenyl-phosphate GlcNAc-1-phosphate transferase